MPDTSPTTLLFVCTGNTCRSPMAAALAQHAIQSDQRRFGPIRVLSAGVAASVGHPITCEARIALQKLGVHDCAHASTPLTPELISEADRIFAMTPGHLLSVQAMSRDNDARLMLLDPSGQGVPDPIGADQSVYDATAELLRRLVDDRLKELER